MTQNIFARESADLRLVSQLAGTDPKVQEIATTWVPGGVLRKREILGVGFVTSSTTSLFAVLGRVCKVAAYTALHPAAHDIPC
jgi:hypothetical protein